MAAADEGRGGAPDGAPLIRVVGLRKRFGTHPAVDGVTFEIGAGEFFCLLGPSGCGKSTLLRLLAGFEAPDAGRIELEGRDLARVPPHRRPFNLMFQSYALFPHLTVAGNVAYGLKRAGLPRREIASRVEEMLALVRLDGFGDRRVGQLSGGQRQRVALARSLARRPRLLLLDEPLAALDRHLREQTQGELKRLQRRLGTAFVVVTHDQEEAMAMADRIGLMEGGRLAQVGTPRTLYERPESRFAAAFLGDANILDGEVCGSLSRTLRVRLRPGSEVDVAAGGATVPVGSSATVVVRPERIGIAPAGALGLPAVVRDVAFLGGSVAVRAEILTGQELRIRRPSSEIAPGLAPGDLVTLAIRPSDAVLLA